jgi:hypothetical protein
MGSKHTSKVSFRGIRRRRLTIAIKDLDNCLNLKMILYLVSFGKCENKVLFNPKPHVARGRYIQANRKYGDRI